MIQKRRHGFYSPDINGKGLFGEVKENYGPKGLRSSYSFSIIVEFWI